ncbi:MAG: asparagine synthase (glutamine-hydrolyzing) [Parvularculaceae bacterium]
MCGIAGIFDLKGEREVDRRALRRMADALAHRGPDGEGFFVEPGIGLAHRRLSIIDVEGGAQPIEDTGRSGVLTFNGEIYNYQELRRRLVEKGAAFKTKSDSEVLAEGLARDQTDFIEKARGMFAFAWWEKRTRNLLLARDRFGEKPLYYALTADGFFIFASEMGAIRASELVDLSHWHEAVALYFHYGYVPESMTIYEGVFKLPAGSILEVAAGREIASKQYWRPQFRVGAGEEFGASKAALLEGLDNAIASALVSNVPIGAFLSGGVDSAAIVSSMARNSTTVETCTIGFEEDAFDERVFSRRTAARYGANAHEEVVSLDAAVQFDRIAHIFGEPFADPSSLPTFLLSKAARRHVKVALSGDGSDEIFGGYRRYPFFAGEEKLRALVPLPVRGATFGAAGTFWPKLDWAPRPFRLKTTLQALGEDSISAYARSVSMIPPDRAEKILSREFMRSMPDFDHAAPLRSVADETLDPFTMAQAIDLATWLPGRMLTKIDRMSMAHGLEVRAPFLDHRFADWALTLPSSFRRGVGGKRILKSALEPRVDRDILYAAKKGFSPPVASWLKDPEGPVSRLCESTRWLNTGFFNEESIGQMIVRHAAGVSDYSAELWALIMFDAFLGVETV